MTKIFAHRGASGWAPENTLEAFELAAKQGADGIELDVQLTRDGEVAVIHDETIDRVSEETGYVKDFTLAQIQKISVHNHMENYRGVKIPSLKEVLELVKPWNLAVNIELKTGVYWYPEIEKKTLDLVRSAGMEERVIYSSFNHYSIQKVKELAPAAETAYLFSDVLLNVEEYARRTGVEGIHPSVYYLHMPGFLEQALAGGEKLRVWTVNREEDMRLFLEKGIEAIITDYPDRAGKLRKELQEA